MGGEGELIGVAIVSLCPLRTGAAGAPQLGSASPHTQGGRAVLRSERDPRGVELLVF